jgi:LysR family hydrogen peroxide-inducible transcriptional activator
MLLLGSGHCFATMCWRSAQVRPLSSSSDGIRKSFEGSSLETIKHGRRWHGHHLVRAWACQSPGRARQGKRRPCPRATTYISTALQGDIQNRRVVLVWRNFTRYEAIAAAQRHLRLQSIDCRGLTRVSQLSGQPNGVDLYIGSLICVILMLVLEKRRSHGQISPAKTL